MSFDNLLKKIKSENNPYLTDSKDIARLVYEYLSRERDAAYKEGQKSMVNNIKTFLAVYDMEA